MSDQPTRIVSTEPEPLDWRLLCRVLGSFDTGRPWTAAELSWECTDPEDPDASLTRLQHNGLIDKIKGYLIPTVAARSCRQLERLTRDPQQLRLPL